MSTTSPVPRPRPRSPGLVSAAVAGAIVILVAAVALNATPPPPPAIAELAPQAVERIEQPPPQQDLVPGEGSGAPPPPEIGDGAVPTPTAIPTDVPREFACFGEPPRQTEDPQSPTCAPYWDPKSDNGGATWFGVTRDEIRVAWPQSIEKTADTENLVKFFNARFQFYGRKIRLVPFTPRGGVFGTWNATDLQADADYVHDELQAFASLAYVPRAGAERHYYDRLADHRIIGVDSHASMRTEEHLTRNQPYEWMYLPAYDTLMRIYGEMICSQLAGRRPVYAGAPIDDSPDPRVFGVVYHVAPEGSSPDRGPMLGALRRGCGTRPTSVAEYTTPEQTILRLKDAGVTTVICLCQGDHYFNLMPEATKQVWFPEWLVSSYHYLDYDSAAQRYPAEHQPHVLGVTFHNKWLPQKEMPWYQAIKEVDPNYETGDDGYASAAYERYYELLVLASGIQMAGPELTPQSFQQGLFRAGFPAAGSGGPPLWYPGGGFGPGDHSMVEDAAMIWYSQSDQGYTTNVRRGTYCYVRHGKRYGLGQFPRTAQPFFEEPCK